MTVRTPSVTVLPKSTAARTVVDMLALQAKAGNGAIDGSVPRTAELARRATTVSALERRKGPAPRRLGCADQVLVASVT